MDSNWIISIVAIIISVGSFVVSTLSYRRDRRKENENHIYQVKIEKYQEVLLKITELVSEISEGFEEIKYNKKDSTHLTEEMQEEIVDNIDNNIASFGYFIAKVSLVFPKEIVEHLSALSDKLFEINIEDEDSELQDKLINSCYDKADLILEEMRNDLNVEVLNLTLYKRIQK